MTKQRRPDREGPHRKAFERNRQIVLKTQNICGICGKEIDPAYKFPHPLSKTVDHIIPVAKGGHPSDLSNLQAAHRWCNRWKSDKLVASLRKEKIFEEDENGENKIDLPQHFDWVNYVPGNEKQEG